MNFIAIPPLYAEKLSSIPLKATQICFRDEYPECRENINKFTSVRKGACLVAMVQSEVADQSGSGELRGSEHSYRSVLWRSASDRLRCASVTAFIGGCGVCALTAKAAGSTRAGER